MGGGLEGGVVMGWKEIGVWVERERRDGFGGGSGFGVGWGMVWWGFGCCERGKGTVLGRVVGVRFWDWKGGWGHGGLWVGSVLGWGGRLGLWSRFWDGRGRWFGFGVEEGGGSVLVAEKGMERSMVWWGCYGGVAMEVETHPLAAGKSEAS
ncbi:uncharacterized protein G2W53_037454 [Senna tora]|uniref:Uncharacterized protein n=1 Tax=Senna tora TaxID=362788 RepID=A0A834W9N1_9FABA|nr:uncharacterized protein G2W53_037454 [Senna tora]